MRMLWLSVLFVVLCASTALGQRDAPVWESYLPKISIYHDDVNSRPAITIDFLFKKHGGPHEHKEHQAYILVYLKKDEEQIIKLAGDPQLVKKENEKKTKLFLDMLVEKKLVVPLESRVARIIDQTQRYADVRGTPKLAGEATLRYFSFPFEFTFTHEKVFQAVRKLGNFHPEDVDVYGKVTWFNDKFKLIVFVPVNDSGHATKVSPKIREAYDFASPMDFDTALLYFRPLPYEFNLKTYETDTLIYIN